jgi:hypothetical protein
LKLKLLISHSYINKKTTKSTTVDGIKELSSDIEMKTNAHTWKSYQQRLHWCTGQPDRSQPQSEY